jgi:hypothetical protein
MKLPYLPLLVLVCILLSLASCYYDNEEALYPSVVTACDTTNVTFSGNIAPMLANNCLSCHSNSNSTGFGNGIRLEDYADVSSYSARIEGAINHTAGYSPMPKNGGMLKSCLITQFGIWLRNGAQNN